MGQLPRFAADAIEPEQIADARGRGDIVNETRCVRRGAKPHDGLIAFCDLSHRTGRHVERAEIGLAFLREILDDAFADGRPERPVPAASTGRGIVSEHTRADIPVEGAREIARLRVLHEIEHPQVRLRVGIHRLFRRRDERDLLSIRTERQSAHVHRDRGELHRVAAARGDGIKFARWPLVVRLIVMERDEINLRAILRPGRVTFIEAARRQLLRLHFLVGVPGRRHHPQMLWTFKVEITFVVRAIDRAGHDVNIAFAF